MHRPLQSAEDGDSGHGIFERHHLLVQAGRHSQLVKLPRPSNFRHVDGFIRKYEAQERDVRTEEEAGFAGHIGDAECIPIVNSQQWQSGAISS